MSEITGNLADFAGAPAAEKPNYLTVSHTVKSWLLTGDHKRIAMMYLASVSFFFLLGGIAASLVRFELTSPRGQVLTHDNYNKMFSAHGIIMVFTFLVPVIPAILGNFLVP